MLSSVVFVALAAAASVSSAPVLSKRIAQNIPESTAKWEQACLAAGGGQQCNPVSVTAFTTLLAAAGPCEQQDAADAMIDLAKTLSNNEEMITLTQIFVQQPRNSPNSVSIPYCQKAPQNSELNGLFQCQFQGSNPTTFVGGVQVGAEGTIPFGLTSALSPAGSCPANPEGPITDGTQLVAVTTDPGIPASGGETPPPSASASESAAEETVVASATESTAEETAVTSSEATGSAPTATATTGAGDFKLQNGKDAQALNAKFTTLTADSPCTAGEDACVEGAFAKCVGEKFVLMPCAGGLQCFALPLVNSKGTSITCDTEADAIARIANTGAIGGLVGDASGSEDSPSSIAESASSSDAASATVSASAVSSAATAVSSIVAGDFKAQNGRDAQALNAKFAGLTVDSGCTAGENACIEGGFAQCVNGKFVISPCSATLQCFALPLVNSKGTSITCDTEADAIARIAASGATGGLTG